MVVPSSTQSHLSSHQVITPPLSSIGVGDSLFEYEARIPCWHVTFSKDGTLIAATYGAPDCSVRIYRQTTAAGNYTLLTTLRDLHTRTIRYCSFAPISKNITLATASFDGTIGIWEAPSPQLRVGAEWECIAQLEGHESECKCVVWNPTATLLATSGRDKSVWLWEVGLEGNIGAEGDFDCLAILNGHEGDVKCVVFAPSHGQFGDGDEICISASYDNSVRIWAEDAGDWYCCSVLKEPNTIWSVAMAPGGLRLMTASADGSIGIYRCYTAEERNGMKDAPDAGDDSKAPSQGFWKCVGRLPQAHTREVLSVAYAPSKAGHGRFASGGPDAIQIYREANESSSEQPLFILDDSTKMNCNSVQWHPQGTFLASGGDDGKVHIWKYRM